MDQDLVDEVEYLIELLAKSKDITERYRCVMAKAKVNLLSGDELVKAMELCVSHYEKCKNFEWNRALLEHVAVWELELASISAKWNRAK